ncbi:hypothetical protein HFC70_04770 [Agrobacterium sp. a22-2]|uniref:hypothetical protein n=1 Tax=Agrobacterium sp. a22-2 TaxID=2283840 RepID=UPI001446FD72|nr:hypothetical protein [Agrobacterium sp. a22-2]NKN35664.1 hypothetical protein [Agrobacterium sp. a22-2]
MADFVAVIRRAVDGLSNNTPEMRAKVYEKARGAVMRQLQNMSPRPPEEMLRRQLDKLEAAIVEVEAEHAEALMAAEEEEAMNAAAVSAAPAFVEPEPAEPEPVEPEAPAAPAPTYTEKQAPVETVEPEPWNPAPEAYVSPAEETDEHAYVGVDEADAAHPVEHVAENPDVFAPAADERRDAAAAGAPFYDYPEGPAAEPAGTLEPETVEPDPYASGTSSAAEDVYAPWPEAAPVPTPEAPAEPVPDEPQEQHGFAPWPEAAETVVHADEPASAVEPAAAPAAFGDWPPYREDASDPFVFPDEPAPSATPVARDEPKPKAAAFDEADALGEFDDFVRSGQSKRPAPEMPPALDLLEWDEADHQTSFVGKDAAPEAAPLEGADAGWFKEFEQGAASASAAPAAAKGKANGTKARASTEDIDALLANAEQKAYRREDKPRRNYAPVVLGVAGVLLLAGAGYGLWVNRDTVSSLVDGLVSSVPSTETAGEQTPPASETPETIVPSGNGTVPADPVANGNGTPAPDGSVTGQKFTQRLLPDGGEVDEGVAATPGGAVPAGEGTSVAEKNVPSDTSPTTPPVQAPAAEGTPATPTTTPPATPGAAPAGDIAMPTDGQKAFLYEERLGQTVPTTVPGHIVWTALRETAENGKAEPVIQGSLSIPGRGLSALITFKRNADNSLPASHLAEVVFSVPADFEGGAIDSIQRIAMKATEQDRGDPLIAVSAKITDDTYMIAFNDFAEVVARNLELLQSRNWIDIPVTYRNGRRALLTLDKGVQGKAVFDSVIKEWATMGSARGG